MSAEQPEPADLDSIGRRHNTDKASTLLRDGVVSPGHDYLRHFEKAVEGFRDDPITVVDLGVGLAPDEFASARMWADYFPRGQIVAIDVQPGLVPPHDRIAFECRDLSKLTEVADLARSHSPSIVVDDAGHLWPHQILSLIYLLPFVRPGGVYIWEDIHTSATYLAEGYSGGYPVSPVDLLGLIAQRVSLGKYPLGQATSGPPRLTTARSEADETELVGAFGALVDGLVEMIDSLTLIGGAAIFRRA